MPSSESPVTDNPDLRRYELDVDGQTVFANYHRQGNVLVITHVEAPPSLRGSGAAGRLMQGLMDILRAENKKVVPRCGYAAVWIRRHHDYADLVV